MHRQQTNHTNLTNLLVAAFQINLLFMSKTMQISSSLGNESLTTDELRQLISAKTKVFLEQILGNFIYY